MLGGCILPTESDLEYPVAQVRGTKVDEGYDKETDELWINVKDRDGYIWHIRWARDEGTQHNETDHSYPGVGSY